MDSKYKYLIISAILLFIIIIIMSIWTTFFLDYSSDSKNIYQITYNGNIISEKIYPAYLVCSNTEINKWYSNQLRDNNKIDANYLLSINIYDSKKDCSWRLGEYVGIKGAADNTPPFSECDSNGTCVLGAGIPNRYRLLIYIPDLNKVFLSENIHKFSEISYYSANLLDDGSIQIKEDISFLDSFPFWSILIFLITSVLIILIKLGITNLFIWKNINKAKIARTEVYASIITLLFLGFLIAFRYYTDTTIVSSWLLIIFIVLFEWLFIYFLNKKSITLWKTLQIVFVSNITIPIIAIISFLLILLLFAPIFELIHLLLF